MILETRLQAGSLEDTLAGLPQAVQALIPVENIAYYRATNAMHCSLESPGGSKFLNVSNMFSMLEKDGLRIAKAVARRVDDREKFVAMGVDEGAFLPATKQKGDPSNLPEALYYKIDGVQGKLGIIELGKLDPAIKVLVRREKSLQDASGREIVPCSFTVIRGKFEDLPDTDFATVIIGRAAGATKDELWTVHPGAPIRTTLGDFISGSENLPCPQENTRQKVMVVTVADLLASGKMQAQDYIKIMPGDIERALERYEIVS